MAHPKLQQVRERYDYRCGYCGVGEADVGGILTIDHFRPRSRGGSNDGDNLVYACARCNAYKGDFYPSEEDLAEGRRLLHPLLDNVAEFVREVETTGALEPLNETGCFHIDLLRLNRPALIQHRLQKRLVRVLERQIYILAEEIKELQLVIDAQEEYLRRIKALLKDEGQDKQGQDEQAQDEH